jgi:nucleoside phosphorylase
MVKVLLIEDEAEKRRLIMACLLESNGITQAEIDEVADAFSAKRHLAQKKYDLVILDINIALRGGQETEVGGGLSILKFVRGPRCISPPTYILGMTAYDNGFETAQKEFMFPLWKLLRFSYGDDSWHAPLKEAVKYLGSIEQPPYPSDGKTYKVDLGIVVALDEELESVLATAWDWKEVPVKFDHNTYYTAFWERDGTRLSVIVTRAPMMGMPAAGVTASKLISAFHPRILAITGICAGVRNKTKVGDILIADPCFDWGSGKWVLDKKSRSLKFRPAPYQWRVDEAVRGAADKLGGDKDFLARIHASFVPEKKKDKSPKEPPQLKIEAMASGASVLQAKALMDDVAEQHKNVVGVEMETYAVYTAAQYAPEPKPLCVSIKAVCDFGDEKKADGYHAYAAHVSAKFLEELALRAFGLPADTD